MRRAIAAHRIGHPAPLIFHLGSALALYQQAILAAPGANLDNFPWHPDLSPYDGPPPDSLDVTVEAAHRLHQVAIGIEAWQRHPYRRLTPDRPVLWSEGSTRLVDYGNGAAGKPVLVVPSLINRAYILDLLPDRSFLSAMAEGGLRPLLLDWGAPGRMEAEFGLDTYLDRRLTPALAITQMLSGGAPAVLGYCMGGTLAAAHVLGRGGVGKLATIGAPWDFAAGCGLSAQIRLMAGQMGLTRLRLMLRTMAQAFGVIPVTLFQQLFALVDPIQVARKFQRFAAMDPDSDRARCFVALEDWLADEVPMAGPAAETLLIDWQLDNATMKGKWRTGPGSKVDIPTLIVAGRRDTIATPGMADPLLRLFPGARHLAPDLGHVGMITGKHAPAEVWLPVVEFFGATP